jgi:hypothetical protein
VERLGYCSQLMEKEQLQSCLVCHFSPKDPHPVKIIHSTEVSTWKNGMIFFKVNLKKGT